VRLLAIFYHGLREGLVEIELKLLRKFYTIVGCPGTPKDHCAALQISPRGATYKHNFLCNTLFLSKFVVFFKPHRYTYVDCKGDGLSYVVYSQVTVMYRYFLIPTWF